MKKNRILKRIGAILLALTLCFGTSLTSFAAEVATEVANENSTEYDVVPMSLYSGSTRFTSTGSFGIRLASNVRNAAFVTFVLGNSNGSYRVDVSGPNGFSDTITVNGDGIHSSFRPISNALAGVYTFRFYQIYGPIVEVVGKVELN